jgi:hypothetical protein
MSNITPPGQALPAAATQAAPVGVPGEIINPPPALGGLATGTILRGVVLRQDAQGHAVVQTDRGSLVVSSALALPPGSQVALQVRAAGSQLLIAILQVDGHPVHGPREQIPAPIPGQLPGQVPGQVPGQAAQHVDGGQAPTPAPPGETGAAQTGHSGPGDRLSLGQTLRAVIQSPGSAAALAALAGAGPAIPGREAPPLAGAPGAISRPLPAGIRLQVTVRQVLPPGAATGSAGQATGPTAGPTPPSGPTPARPASPPGAPHTPPHAAPPGSPPGSSPGSPPGRIEIAGLVIGSAAKGQPLVETPLGTLTLNLDAGAGGGLPQGTRLLLQLAAADLIGGRGRALPGAAHASAQGGAGATALAYTWPALAEALEVLAGPEGGAAHGALSSRAVPQPGPRLASTILFFLQALGGGQLAAWLGGQAAEVLQRDGRGALLERLAQDFKQLGRLAETTSGEWRLLPFPFYDGSQLHQLRLFLRHGPKGRGPGRESGAGEDEEATRFILDVDNSRFGELQLDGLVRSRRFDLILRSRAPLPKAMRRDIATIFDQTNGAVGSAGQIGFQASRDWQAMALAETAHAAPELLV